MGKRVKVKFIKFFEPYGLKAGATREVSEEVAHKLLERYGVIEDPFHKKRLFVTVRVVKSLVKKYGGTWFPTSEHLVTPEVVKDDLENGSLVIIEDEIDEAEDPLANFLGGPGRERKERNMVSYRVIKTFAYDHLMWRKGLTFQNNILDFSEQIENGEIEILRE